MLIYLLLVVAVIFINAFPALMPPTWTVLSFFYVKYNLSFWPGLVLGIGAAATGRILLYLMAKHWFKKWVPKKFYANYLDLGTLLQSGQKFTIPVILTFLFSPVSSNWLFIIAGLSNLNIKVLITAFVIGRLASYSFWMTTTYNLYSRFEDIITSSLSNTQAMAWTVISIMMVLIVGKIKWGNFLKK